MDERDFFIEKNESHPLKLNCSSCKQEAEYQVRWTRDYTVRVDDLVRCSNPRCGKRIEITSQSVVLL